MSRRLYGDILDDGIVNPPVGGGGGIKDPYIDLHGRNIRFLGAFAPITGENDEQSQMAASFYANKVYIRVEEEQVGEEKITITGIIKIRWKKRRSIELELPFFDKFNQFEDEYRPGYREFEIIINSNNLSFQYYGETKGYYITTEVPNTHPYYDPDITFHEAIPVVLKEKKVEYLDNLIDKKIVKLTLVEKKSRYAQ